MHVLDIGRDRLRDLDVAPKRASNRRDDDVRHVGGIAPTRF
jgi:hypothetical protein